MLNFNVKVKGELYLLKINTCWEYFWKSHKEGISYELINPSLEDSKRVISRYNAKSIKRVASYPYYYM